MIPISKGMRLAPALLLFAASGALWLDAMAGPALQAAALGPICGGHAFGLHCSRCVAALALGAIGLAALALWAPRRVVQWTET